MNLFMLFGNFVVVVLEVIFVVYFVGNLWICFLSSCDDWNELSFGFDFKLMQECGVFT